MSSPKIEKSLDSKLEKIRGGSYSPRDFIIADAKDPDMAFAIQGMGPRADGSIKSRPEFLKSIADVCTTGIVDVMLTSASNGEALTFSGLFENSKVTLAIRANDTTDIWRVRGGAYHAVPSRPFRSADIEVARGFCDLSLYSMTFNNDIDADYASLDEFAAFRADATAVGMRYFLEVFNPNAPQNLTATDVPAYVNDMIVRSLAGVTRLERPQFLKMQYNGARAMDELVSFDPGLVVGVLGGSSGTTRDCFELLHQAERNGARVALFGRKINWAESPLDLISFFKPVLESAMTPRDAVRAYHDILKQKNIRAKLTLLDDLNITEPALEGFGGNA